MLTNAIRLSSTVVSPSANCRKVEEEVKNEKHVHFHVESNPPDQSIACFNSSYQMYFCLFSNITYAPYLSFITSSAVHSCAVETCIQSYLVINLIHSFFLIYNPLFYATSRRTSCKAMRPFCVARLLWHITHRSLPEPVTEEEEAWRWLLSPWQLCLLNMPGRSWPVGVGSAGDEPTDQHFSHSTHKCISQQVHHLTSTSPHKYIPSEVPH